MPLVKPESKELVVREMGGLVTEPDVLDRPQNSWAFLDGFDLIQSGTITKADGLEELSKLLVGQSFVYDSPIVAFTNWRRTESDPLMLLGLSVSGGLYDLKTGNLVAQFPTANYAWMGVITGTANGSETINYVVATTAGYIPFKWNGQTPPTRIGVDPPSGGVTIFRAVTDPDNAPDRGIAVLQSRQYRYTFWNPSTRHDSSPSPDELSGINPRTGETGYFQSILSSSSGTVVTDPNHPYIDSIWLFVPDAEIHARVSEGYVRFRVWATRDGGEVFYLVNNASLNYNDTIIDADVDGSLPVPLTGDANILDGMSPVFATVLVAQIIGDVFITLDPSDTAFEFIPRANGTLVYIDGTAVNIPYTYDINTGVMTLSAPLAQPLHIGSIVGCIWTTEIGKERTPAPDPSLVQPAPNLGQNDPPPCAIWGAIYQDRIFWVNAQKQSEIRYSNIDDFESYDIDNRISLPSRTYDPITSLEGEYQQLVIGKRNALAVLTGTDLQNFVVTPLDPQIGSQGRRSMISVEGVLFYLSKQGIMVWQGVLPQFYGQPIKPLTDDVPFDQRLEKVVAAVDSVNGVVIFYVNDESEANPRLILADVSRPLPFSTYPLPLNLFGMAEIEDPDTNEVMVIAGLADSKVYRLFIGFTTYHTNPQTQVWETTPVSAFAVSQAIPQDNLSLRLVFRHLRVEGELLDGFLVSYSVDGGGWTKAQKLYQHNFIGLVGKHIQVRFQHTTDVGPIRAAIPNYSVEYVPMGVSR